MSPSRIPSAVVIIIMFVGLSIVPSDLSSRAGMRIYMFSYTPAIAVAVVVEFWTVVE